MCSYIYIYIYIYIPIALWTWICSQSQSQSQGQSHSESQKTKEKSPRTSKAHPRDTEVHPSRHHTTKKRSHSSQGTRKLAKVIPKTSKIGPKRHTKPVQVRPRSLIVFFLLKSLFYFPDATRGRKWELFKCLFQSLLRPCCVPCELCLKWFGLHWRGPNTLFALRALPETTNKSFRKV